MICEPNGNEATNPVEVESESNGDSIKDNNEQKNLTEDTESKSEVMDEVKMKTENENEATKPEFRESNGHEPNADNVKKGELNNNKGTKPVEVEKIELNGDDAKENNDPKKLTEDTESKSEVVDEVKTETENENKATKSEVREKDNEVTDDKQTKTDNNKDDNENEAKKKSEDKEKIHLSKSFIAISAKPTRERGGTRAKYMYRLARQLKNRDRTEPTKDEWSDLTSLTDTSTMGSGPNLEDLTESVM